MRGRSVIPFLAARSGDAVGALAGAQIFSSSAGCGWADVHVEVGRNGAWEVDDVIVPRHYLALNTDDLPLSFEAKVEGAFRRVVLAPGELWFCPAGEPFSHRVPVSAGFTLVTLQPSKLARVVADDRIELRRTYSVAKPQLEQVLEQRNPDLLNVALRFGFSDQAHFTRLFKRQFGAPPGRFVRERAR